MAEARQYQIGDLVPVAVVFTTKATRGTIQAGTAALTVEQPAGYAPGDEVVVAGAGPGGAELFASVDAVNGQVLTLAAPAVVSVQRALVGELADPGATTARIGKPDGTVLAYTYGVDVELVKDGVGRYHVNVPVDQAGWWTYRFAGTGAVADAEEHYFAVIPSEFTADGLLSPRALVRLPEARSSLKIDDQAEDLHLVRLIKGVSTQIHRVSRREIVPLDATQHTRRIDISAAAARERVVEIPDLNVLAAVAVEDFESGTATAVPLEAVLELPRLRQEWEPILRLRFRSSAELCAGDVLAVTATWGFPQVPDDLKQACIEAVGVWRDQDREHYREDMAAEARQEGTTIILGASTIVSRTLPDHAQAVAESYRRRRPVLGSVALARP